MLTMVAALAWCSEREPGLVIGRLLVWIPESQQGTIGVPFKAPITAHKALLLGLPNAPDMCAYYCHLVCGY